MSRRGRAFLSGLGVALLFALPLLPEIVGSAGVLVDALDVRSIAEALSRLASDGDDLRNAGPRRSAQFAWADAARITLEVLRQAGQQDAHTAPRYQRPSAAS